MKSMKKTISFLGLWLCGLMMLQAANIEFTAQAPAKVVVGQRFQLVYTVNDDGPKDLRIPELDGFDILYGPATSMSNQISIVNGKREAHSWYSFTYTLQANTEGTFNIAAATVNVKKEQYTSNPLTITVLPADKTPSGSSGAASGSSSSSNTQAGSSQNLSAENLFIRVIPSKTHVMEQEGFVLTYKLYSRVDIAGMENARFPELKGFLAQEIELPENREWDMENYNGSNYRTVVLKQTVLYPQQSGELTIEPAEIEMVARIRSERRSRSLFDDFFDSYQDVRKTLTTRPVKITVDPFPFGKPANFNSFTGTLSASSSISTTDLKADEGVTLKIVLEGNGNMKMLKTPELSFPADFDVYDPKVSNDFNTGGKGQYGTKTIEYLVIPRYAGNFEIPSVELSYYDLPSHSYKTLKTDSYTLNVARSDNSDGSVVSGNFTNKENVRQLGQDIRYIKTDGLKLQSQTKWLRGSKAFWCFYLIPLLLFAFILWLYRKQVKANADASAVRTRKANKVAVKRLKTASTYLKAADREHFYDEVLKALWGYTGDKLNIPQSQLTKESVDAQLTRRGVGEELRKAYMSIVETCEFERYAPSSNTQAMDELYTRTLQVIDQMENSIKKS